MIVALWSMDPRALRTPPPAVRKPGAIREGLRHVRRTPELAVPLALMALVGTLGFNFQVALPLLAKFSFGGGAGSYAVLVSAMGVGSIVAALVNGNRGETGGRVIAAASLAFGVAALLAAAMPEPDPRGGLARRARRRRGDLRLLGQLDDPARRLGRDAGPGDGPLLDRLPRLDPDRRPADRLAGGSLRPARGPGPGRDLRPQRRLGGAGDLHPDVRAGGTAVPPARASV